MLAATILSTLLLGGPVDKKERVWVGDFDVTFSFVSVEPIDPKKRKVPTKANVLDSFGLIRKHGLVPYELLSRDSKPESVQRVLAKPVKFSYPMFICMRRIANTPPVGQVATWRNLSSVTSFQDRDYGIMKNADLVLPVLRNVETGRTEYTRFDAWGNSTNVIEQRLSRVPFRQAVQDVDLTMLGRMPAHRQVSGISFELSGLPVTLDSAGPNRYRIRPRSVKLRDFSSNPTVDFNSEISVSGIIELDTSRFLTKLDANVSLKNNRLTFGPGLREWTGDDTHWAIFDSQIHIQLKLGSNLNVAVQKEKAMDGERKMLMDQIQKQLERN